MKRNHLNPFEIVYKIFLSAGAYAFECERYFNVFEEKLYLIGL